MPATVSVTVNVCPEFMMPESKVLAPVGTSVEVTVCCIVSSFVHVIVLLTPITTVMFAGVKFSV